MERKSSFESRNKRKLQSDEENKRTRHKGGGSNQHKLDGDIRMETIIYKLDSRNKIVLPRVDETNMDNAFLQYVKARLEEKNSPTDNGNGRRHSNEKTRRHEHTRNSKRYSYDTDASMEERTYARNSTRKEHRGSRNGRHNHYGDEPRRSYVSEKRPSSNGYERNVGFCSCKQRRNNQEMDQNPAPVNRRHSHADDERRMSYISDKRPSDGYDGNVGACSCKQRRNNSAALPQEMDQNPAPVNRRYSYADDERRMSYISDKRPSEVYDENVDACSWTPYDSRPSDAYDGNVGSCDCNRRRASEMAYPREQNVTTVNGPNICDLNEEQMLQCFQLVFRKLCTLQNGNGTRMEIDVANTNQDESPPVNYNDMQASSMPVENQLSIQHLPTNTQVYAETVSTPSTRSPRNTPLSYTLPPPQPPPPRERARGSGMTQKAYFYPSTPKRDFTEPVETRILGKQFDVNEQQIASTVDNPNENATIQSVGDAEPIIEVPQPNQQYATQVAAPTEQHFEQQQQQHQQYEQQPHNQLETVEEHSSLTAMENYPTEFNRESMLRSSTQSGAAGAVDRQSLESGYAQNRGSQQSGQHNSAPQQIDSGTPQHQALPQPHNTNLEVLMGINAANQQNAAAQQIVSGTPQHQALTQPQDTSVEVLMGVNSSNPADFTGSIGKHSYQNGPIPMTFPMAPNLNPNSFLRQDMAPPNTSYLNPNTLIREHTPQPNTNYPIYPYGFKNGLQKLSADSVQIIPNVTVLDYNETCCSIPICSPVSNTSYEYILMRVKKNRHF